MSTIFQFEWDTKKARANEKKHKGVSFKMAMSVLHDPMAMTLYDDDHSDYEERWVTIGLATHGQCLVVIHTITEISATEVLIRIISARKADPDEQRDYVETPR